MINLYKILSIPLKWLSFPSFLLVALLINVEAAAFQNVIDEELPPPSGTVVNVSDMAGLLAAIIQANETGNVDIILEPGIYEYDVAYVSWIKWGLLLGKDNITIRSKTGNRDDVIIRGKGMDGNISSIFVIGGDNITVANVTLGWVTNHAIQVKGESDADNFLAHNVRFVDTYQQLFKVSYNSGAPEIAADNGIIRYCLFEYTAGVGPQWYIGGIDCHNGKNWLVKENVFRNIVSPENRLAEHAIHFWSESENTTVEGNLITNCDRGIGFGLGDRGHGAGLIMNNMVHTTRDVGIGLENADGVKVFNNTVVSENYPFSIEYRFTGTNAIIKNNLCNASIELRNDASGELSSNVEDFTTSGFVNYQEGDLHLLRNKSNRKLLVDKGVALGEVLVDFDNESRPAGRGYDIGADELVREVKGIHITPKFLYMEPNRTRPLNAIVFPFTAYDKSVEWSTSDSLVAKVDESGNVTAISPGKATITAITNDGGFTAESHVWVKSPHPGFNASCVKVYPVPLRSGNLTIEWETEGSSQVTIHSFNEELVVDMVTESQHVEIPRSAFDEGIYVITIHQNGEQVKRKILVK